MKYLIFITLLFVSCTLHETPNGVIFSKSVIKQGDNCCSYISKSMYIDLLKGDIKVYTNGTTTFIAPCDSFIVGDTIVLAKPQR